MLFSSSVIVALGDEEEVVDSVTVGKTTYLHIRVVDRKSVV